MNRAMLNAVAVAVFATTAAPAAFAADNTSATSVVVKYGDLDLHSEEGRKKLERRIVRAARLVCPNNYSRSAQTSAAGRACISRTVEGSLDLVSQRRAANPPARQTVRR